MPSRESESKEPTEENADAPLSKRRNMQLPYVPRLARAGTLIGQGPVARKKDDLTPPRDRMLLKKSGEKVEVRWAQMWEARVRKLLEKHPWHFQTLHRLVEGDKENVSKRQLKELREWGYLAPDYSPLPGVQAVMHAAFRLTPDGPCIVDPLDVKTSEDMAIMQRVDDQLGAIRAKGLEHLYRRLADKNEEEDKGHAR